MSKRELTKWKNKYKLWEILHPGDKGGCLYCSHWSHWILNNKEGEKICPHTILALLWDETGDTWIEEIENYTSHEGDFHCIEWIKDV